MEHQGSDAAYVRSNLRRNKQSQMDQNSSCVHFLKLACLPNHFFLSMSAVQWILGDATTKPAVLRTGELCNRSDNIQRVSSLKIHAVANLTKDPGF